MCASAGGFEQRAVSIHDAGRQPAGSDRRSLLACSRSCRSIPVITDVNSDQQNRGLQSLVQYDRSTAARFGISPQLIDNTLYDAFGQRQVSTMYTSLESVSRGHGSGAGISGRIRCPCATSMCVRRADKQVPLSAFSTFAPATAPLSVTHQGLFPAVTISFNLQPGVALGDAVDAIDERPPRSVFRQPFTPDSPEPRKRIRIRSAASHS